MESYSFELVQRWNHSDAQMCYLNWADLKGFATKGEIPLFWSNSRCWTFDAFMCSTHFCDHLFLERTNNSDYKVAWKNLQTFWTVVKKVLPDQIQSSDKVQHNLIFLFQFSQTQKAWSTLMFSITPKPYLFIFLNCKIINMSFYVSWWSESFLDKMPEGLKISLLSKYFCPPLHPSWYLNWRQKYAALKISFDWIYTKKA